MDYNELYGQCFNIPPDDCNCCDKIKQFYLEAREWYEELRALLTAESSQFSTITISIEGRGTVSDNLGNVWNKKVFSVNDNVTLIARPDTGYKFKHWKTTSTILSTNNKLVEYPTIESITIIAVFELETQPTVEYKFQFGSASSYELLDNNKQESTLTFKNLEDGWYRQTIDFTVSNYMDKMYFVFPHDIEIYDIFQGGQYIPRRELGENIFESTNKYSQGTQAITIKYRKINGT